VLVLPHTRAHVITDSTPDYDSDCGPVGLANCNPHPSSHHSTITSAIDGCAHRIAISQSHCWAVRRAKLVTHGPPDAVPHSLTNGTADGSAIREPNRESICCALGGTDQLANGSTDCSPVQRTNYGTFGWTDSCAVSVTDGRAIAESIGRADICANLCAVE
jgi:hypothetical protein